MKALRVFQSESHLDITQVFVSFSLHTSQNALSTVRTHTQLYIWKRILTSAINFTGSGIPPLYTFVTRLTRLAILFLYKSLAILKTKKNQAKLLKNII
jgi:hypothetical protein